MRARQNDAVKQKQTMSVNKLLVNIEDNEEYYLPTYMSANAITKTNYVIATALLIQPKYPLMSLLLQYRANDYFNTIIGAVVF